MWEKRVVEGRRWDRVMASNEIERWPMMIELKGEWEWERRVREMGWGSWEKWEGKGRVYKFIYIYIWFFGNFSFIRVRFKSGFEAGFTKTRTRPRPALGFILKIQTWSYYFVGRVKPAPLGSGRAGCPRVRYFLPSLHARYPLFTHVTLDGTMNP